MDHGSERCVRGFGSAVQSGHTRSYRPCLPDYSFSVQLMQCEVARPASDKYKPGIEKIWTGDFVTPFMLITRGGICRCISTITGVSAGHKDIAVIDVSIRISMQTDCRLRRHQRFRMCAFLYSIEELRSERNPPTRTPGSQGILSITLQTCTKVTAEARDEA